MDLLFDKTQSTPCPDCGNYRLKFGNEWLCPQSGRFCAVYDRMGKKKLKEVRPWNSTHSNMDNLKEPVLAP